MEPGPHEQEAGCLVGENTDPYSAESEMEHIHHDNCGDGTDERDTDECGNERIAYITGGPHASGIDDLGDLEKDNDR